jgi:hypothetical protein
LGIQIEANASETGKFATGLSSWSGLDELARGFKEDKKECSKVILIVLYREMTCPGIGAK